MTQASEEAGDVQDRLGSAVADGHLPVTTPDTAPPQTGATAGLGCPVPAQEDPRALYLPTAIHFLPASASTLSAESISRKDSM